MNTICQLFKRIMAVVNQVSYVRTMTSKINVTLKRCQMKFDRSIKFDFCYYGQVNSQRLKYNVASKWAGKHQ